MAPQWYGLNVFERNRSTGILEQVHLVPVEFAGAREIADILTQIFEPQKTKSERD